MHKRPLAPLIALVAVLGASTGLIGSAAAGTVYLSAEGALPPLSRLLDDPGAWWEEARGRHAAEEAPAPVPVPAPPPAATAPAEPAPAKPAETAPAPVAAGDTDTAAGPELAANGPESAPRAARGPLGPPPPALRERIQAQRQEQIQQQGRSAPPAQASAPEATAASGGCAVEGVTQVDATHYILSRSFVNTYIRDSDRAQRQGLAQWANDKDGDRTGVRLRKLRCAPRTAGLHNGDVVKSVNGRPVRTTVEAWSAYREVSGSDRFTAVVKRKGSTLTLHYEVR